MAEPPGGRTQRDEDSHERNIAVLFANETFTIGMLQAVSGASLFAALAQWHALTDLTGRFPPLIFLTLMCLALITAVIAAYFKHQYKMWDVKATASGFAGRMEEATERLGDAKCYLRAMRYAMFAAALAIVLALGWLLVVAWVRALCPTLP